RYVQGIPLVSSPNMGRRNCSQATDRVGDSLLVGDGSREAVRPRTGRYVPKKREKEREKKREKNTSRVLLFPGYPVRSVARGRRITHAIHHSRVILYRRAIPSPRAGRRDEAISSRRRYRHANRPLLGGTAKTDRRQSIEGKEEEEEKKKEVPPFPTPSLPARRRCPRPREIFLPRMETKRLPAWGEATTYYLLRSLVEHSCINLKSLAFSYLEEKPIDIGLMKFLGLCPFTK
ncbi:hypothetical protein GW17_00046736, partial [Ensete ventricosum]